MDPAQLNKEYLPGFENVWTRTYNHLGYVMDDQLPDPVWRDLRISLAERFPLDGSAFTTLWRKRSA